MRWLACLIVLTFPLAAQSQQYVGAKEALRQIDSALPTTDSGAQLDAQITAFENGARKMSPEVAAAAWFRLAEKSIAKPSPEDMASGYNPMRSGKVLAVRPPPASWPFIEQLARKGLASGPKTAGAYLLLLTAQVLQADEVGEWQTLETLAARKPKPGESGDDGVLALYAALAATNRDAARVERGLRLQARAPRPDATIEVPDVVGVMGASKAEVLLRDIILNNQVTLSSNAGEATAALARKVALDTLAKLKYPQWNLALSVDATGLIRRLAAKISRQAGTKVMALIQQQLMYAVGNDISGGTVSLRISGG